MEIKLFFLCCILLSPLLLLVSSTAAVQSSTEDIYNDAICRSDSYYYDETQTAFGAHRCYSDCECDGVRICDEDLECEGPGRNDTKPDNNTRPDPQPSPDNNTNNKTDNNSDNVTPGPTPHPDNNTNNTPMPEPTPKPDPKPTPKPDPKPEPQPDPKSRVVYIVSKQTNKALTVNGGSNDDVSPVVIATEKSQKYQQWRLELQDDGYYVIRAMHSLKVLDIEGASTVALARLIQYHVHYGNNQRFKITPKGNDWVVITAKHSGKVLDVYGAGTADGTQVIQYPEHDHDNQLWKLVDINAPAPTPKSKTVVILSKQSSKAITVLGASQNAVTPMVIDPLTNAANQRFVMEANADGFYKFTAVHSNQVMDIEGGSTGDLARLIQYPSHGGNNQQFSVSYQSDGYAIIKARHSGRVLDVYGASTADNTQIIQYGLHNGANQLWKIVEYKPDPTPTPSPIPPTTKATYIISKQSGKAVTVSGGSLNDIAEVDIMALNKINRYQMFTLEMQSDGYHVIRAVHSGKVLDIEGASQSAVARLIQYHAHYGNNQRFLISSVGNGYFTIKAKHSGQILDVYGGITADGTKIIQYPAHYGDNQLWSFQTVDDDLPPAPTPDANEAQVPINQEIFIVSKKSEKVLDVYGGSKAEVTPLIIWPLHTGNNQRFTISSMGGDVYAVTATHSGLVLDIEGDNRGDNARLIQYHHHTGGNQQFRFIHVANGWFKIQCKNSGRFLSVKDGSTNDATNVVQYSDIGTDSQLWRLVPTVNTNQEIVLNSKSGVAASVLSNVKDTSVIADVPDPENENQKEHWQLQFMGDKLFSIVSTYTGNALTASTVGIFATRGAASQSAYSKGNSQQLWYLDHFGDGYYTIRSKNSGFVLEAGSLSSGLVLSKVSYGPSQLWNLKSIIPFNQDTYIISSLNDKNLEILGDKTYDNLPIVAGCPRKVNSQIWVIEPLISGYYRIRNKNSGKYMSVEKGSVNPLSKMVQNEWDGGFHQQFSFSYVGQSVYTIKARNSLFLLDVMNNSTKDGAQIVQYTATGEESQNFYFETNLPKDINVMFYNYHVDSFIMELNDLGSSPVVDKLDGLLSQKRDWQLHLQGSTNNYLIINTATNRVLQANSDFSVSLADKTGAENQLWTFDHVSKGWFKIRSNLYTDRVLDFKERNTVKQGFLVTLEKEDYSESQLWNINYSSSYHYDPDVINDSTKDFFVRGGDNALWHKSLTGASWSDWENLGGVITSDPGYSSWKVGRLDAFVKGTDNAMWHKWFEGGKWSGWESLGGVIVSAPVAVSWGLNRIDAFAIGTDNALWHRWWNGNAWLGWESLGGVCTSEPAVGSIRENELDVFVRGTDLALWHRRWNGKAWLGWECLGGVLTSGPSVAVWRENRIDVLVRGTDWAVWRKSYDDIRWSNWESLGGSIVPKPITAFWRKGKLDVYVYGEDGNLFQKTFDNYGTGWSNWFSIGGILSTNQVVQNRRQDFFVFGSNKALMHRVYENKVFSGWENLGGVLTSDPGYSSWNYGRFDVFVRGTDMALWHKWYWNGWQGWESLGGVLTSKPTAISWGNNRIDVFVIGTDRALWHRWWNGAGWYGWESLGGVCTSAPAVGSLRFNQLSIFVRGTDNALWHRQWNNGWANWQSLGGVLTSAPSVATWTEKRIDVFVRGTDSALWQQWFDGNNWSGWVSRGGVLKDETIIANWRDGILDVYVRGMNGAIYQKTFNYFTGSWTDYVSFGSSIDV